MKKKRFSELLAPAGNFEKLKTALYFGADAVYLGGKDFSLRFFADNFTADEMKRAVETAHAAGKKVYVTANIFARNADFSALSDYFRFLSEIGADAALVTDAGVFAAARAAAPNLKLHLSTQANTTNKYAAKFWYGEGAERVVLARELSVAEISEIRDFCPELQLEAFVHGAMCISYSGRCLLSNYLAGRDSNRGECVQACRWKYEVRAEGASCPVEEDARGTYIFNSKDLNLIGHLKELSEAGVDSFKIEGRMKSAYYLATVVNAYRRAFDRLAGKPSAFSEEEILRGTEKMRAPRFLRPPTRWAKTKRPSITPIHRQRGRAISSRKSKRAANVLRSWKCATVSASAKRWKFCRRRIRVIKNLSWIHCATRREIP